MRRISATRMLGFVVCATLAVACASTAVAGTTSGYAAWTSGPPNDTSLLTPHKDFQLTTQKCAVCHAVHKADAGGQLLLRTSVQDACVYCHIETDIGVDRIYDGDTANYTTEDNRGHQSPAVECVDCHAVHGANTFAGYFNPKILKVFNIQQTALDELVSGDASVGLNITGNWTFDPKVIWGWDAQDVQDALFCSQCHPYYTSASENTITADVIQSDGSFVTTSFKSHPLKVPGMEQGNGIREGFVAEGSTLPTDSILTAMLHTRGCGQGSCHGYAENSHGPGLLANSYPHYMVDTVRFLGMESNATPAQSSTQDGICLGCHQWLEWDGSQNVTTGVGVTY